MALKKLGDLLKWKKSELLTKSPALPSHVYVILTLPSLWVREAEVERERVARALFREQNGREGEAFQKYLPTRSLKETERQTSRESFPELPSRRGVTRCQHCGSARVAV